MKRPRKKNHPLDLPRNKGSPASALKVGNISGGKGFAIGPGAKAVVIELGSLFDFTGLSNFVARNWIILVTSIILQCLVLVLWVNFAHRYQISPWILIVIMGSMGVITAASIGLQTHRHRRWHILLMAVSLIALIGTTAGEYKRIQYPQKFTPEVFGVAVAQFGEGPSFQNSVQAREVSQIVLNQLTKQAEENPGLDFVKFKPIGLIETQEEAIADGHRVGADLVIWGQLQVSENQTILYFSIIETPDKVSNPMFPRALPLYDVAASSLFRIHGQKTEEISRGTTTISAFIFGLANFFKRDFGAAARAFEEALSLSSYEKESDYRYLSHFYYGLTLQRLDKLEEANTQFQRAILIHPEDPASWIASAFNNNSLGNIEEAQQQARTAIELCSDRIQLDSEEPENYYNRAQADEILHDWELALTDYQTAIEKAPDLYIAYIGVARIQLITGQYPMAIQACKEAIELAESKDANPAWAYVYLGHIYQLVGDSVNARAALVKAVELAPEVDYMHFKLAQFLEITGQAGDLPSAEEEYKVNIRLSDKKAWASSEYAKFLVRQERLDEAVVQYRAALQYESKSARIWIELAKLQARLGRIIEARNAYQQAVSLEPKDLYARLSFGMFLFAQGEYTSSIREWEIARQIDPTNCDLLVNLGQAYEMTDELEKAKALYLEAYALTPNEDPECQKEATRRVNEYLP